MTNSALWAQILLLHEWRKTNIEQFSWQCSSEVWPVTLSSALIHSSVRVAALYYLFRALAIRWHVSYAASSRKLKVRVGCINWEYSVNVLGIARAVYEGVEEYSCKYFAVRKDKLKLSEKEQGPLVCVYWTKLSE